jgi:Domain of unknown function (DUF4158)
VSVRFLSDAQRDQLSGFPAELGGGALDRFFTFSEADLAEVWRRHGEGNRNPYAPWLSRPSSRVKEMSRVEQFENIRRDNRVEGLGVRAQSDRYHVYRRKVR